jgi:UDP-N-acetyl-D-glucosamine dehydrogenase
MLAFVSFEVLAAADAICRSHPKALSRLLAMQIGIIGLGYVGLPLAVAFAEAGCDVVGLDVDAGKVEALNAGRSYIEDVPDATLEPLAGKLRATGEYAELASCDAVILCVPTPLSDSREPDLTYLVESATALAAVLRSGQLVVLESTTYPGTTRDRLLPILETSGLTAGSDFHLAFSPERIDPGRTDFTVKTTPKLVGGVTEASTERARELYAEICDTVVVLSSPEAAELSKLLENIFRSVNIALVNELAQLCDRLGIDVWEVVDAAATKPFGFMRFDPGPGMGGHCLPVDPFYLAFRARQLDFYPEFIELAGKVNQAQPGFCVERIERALNGVRKPVNGSRVLVLGVSYKGGVGDVRESPALKIIGRLQDLGAEVSYHDSFVAELPGHGLASAGLEPALAECDIAAIVTAHPDVDYERVVAAAPLTIDFRGVTMGIEAEGLVRL